MKNLISLFVLALTLSACDSNKDSTVFDSDKLIGKYRVDITPIVNEAFKSETSENEWEQMGKGLAALALSSVDIEISFYENKKGVTHMSGGLIDFAAAFSKEPVQKTNEFTYKVEHDSILYIRNADSKEFERWAIVRKFSENYDYLQFLIVEEGEDKVFFNLKKIHDKD